MTTTRIENIGTLTLTTAYRHTETFECAAWHRTVEVAPGTYPVCIYIEHGYSAPPKPRLYVRATGVVVSASFRALFAGNPIGGTRDRGADEAGKEHATSWEIAAHAEGFAVTHPGLYVVVEERSYEGSVWSETENKYVPGTRSYTYSAVERRAGWRFLCTRHERAALAQTARLIPAGELPRAEQIAIAAEAIERARAADYWTKRDCCESDARAVFAIITHADVRARAKAAFEKAGVSLWAIPSLEQAVAS